jgi:hypothetical protein
MSRFTQTIRKSLPTAAGTVTLTTSITEEATARQRARWDALRDAYAEECRLRGVSPLSAEGRYLQRQMLKAVANA